MRGVVSITVGVWRRCHRVLMLAMIVMVMMVVLVRMSAVHDDFPVG